MSTQNANVIKRFREHIASCNPQELEVTPLLTVSVIDTAESELGFALPVLLRDIYTKIGTGYIGFQCSLLELVHPNPTENNFIDDPSVVELYQHFKSNNIVPTTNDPLGEWPDQLVPFCAWGCHIYSCIDCSKSPFPVYGYDPSLYEYDQLFLHTYSFSTWMEDLLSGNDLWLEMKELSGR